MIAIHGVPSNSAFERFSELFSEEREVSQC